MWIQSRTWEAIPKGQTTTYAENGTVCYSVLSDGYHYGIAYKNDIVWLDRDCQLHKYIDDYNCHRGDNLPKLRSGYEHSLRHFWIAEADLERHSDCPEFAYQVGNPDYKSANANPRLTIEEYVALLTNFGEF